MRIPAMDLAKHLNDSQIALFYCRNKTICIRKYFLLNKWNSVNEVARKMWIVVWANYFKQSVRALSFRLMFVLVELPKYLFFIKVQMYLLFLYSMNPFMSSLSSSGDHWRLFCGERAGDSDLRFSGFLTTTGVCWRLWEVEGVGFGRCLFLFIGTIESLSNPEQIDDWLAGGELFWTCWRTWDWWLLLFEGLRVGATEQLALSAGVIEPSSSGTIFRLKIETRLLSSSSKSESSSEISVGSVWFLVSFWCLLAVDTSRFWTFGEAFFTTVDFGLEFDCSGLNKFLSDSLRSESVLSLSNSSSPLLTRSFCGASRLVCESTSWSFSHFDVFAKPSSALGWLWSASWWLDVAGGPTVLAIVALSMS